MGNLQEIINFYRDYLLGELELKQIDIAKQIKINSSDLTAFKGSPCRKNKKEKQEKIADKLIKCYNAEYEKYIAELKPQKTDKFIYYYYSLKNKVKTALFEIDIVNENWSGGRLTYYGDYDIENATPTVFNLIRIYAGIETKKPTDNQVVFFKATNEDKHHVNFFTINTRKRSLDKRIIMFLTYSVVEDQGELPSCGWGILKKIEAEEEEIKSIEIQDWILNALENKKLPFRNEFQKHVYSSEIEILQANKQFDNLKGICGFYVGYFLKQNKDIEIVKIVLEIMASGHFNIYHHNKKSNDVNKPKYSGFMFFRAESEVQILARFAFEDSSQTHRLSMILDNNHGKLEGIVSGWANISDKSIHSSPIFFDSLGLNSIKEAINEINPREIENSEWNTNKEEFEKIKNRFKKIEEKCFRSVSMLPEIKWQRGHKK